MYGNWVYMLSYVFFFSSRRRHTRFDCDWSSDVCSSDLMPRGMPQGEVTFDLDANGIVNVSAKDMGTGREQKITITASSGLSKEEIDKMMRDAEAHSADDVRKREEIEARNRLDGLVYQMEKTVNENREKVGAVAGEVET